MKFLVRKTSAFYCDETAPCEGATRTKYTHYDWRTVKTPEKLTYANALQDWYGRGTNHRCAKGWIVRDIESEGWAIDIETIDDLMAFVDKNGDIVIQKDDAEDFPWLEIYDTYRE